MTESARSELSREERDKRVEGERRLLAAVCQNTLDAAGRFDVMQRLAECALIDPEHEVIFRALTKMAAGDPERTRMELAVRITRLGFPDFDVDPFFNIAPAGASELPALFALLEI
jgi:hypothetical protein